MSLTMTITYLLIAPYIDRDLKYLYDVRNHNFHIIKMSENRTSDNYN
jgi:hypothetical protein